MAVDEAMMQAVSDGAAPTLRLYGWRPAAVSLGYFQSPDEGIDREQVMARGYGLVRRPTGGRAILHDDEVTYSVAIRESEVPHGHSVMQSYRYISRGVEAGLQRLGVGAQLVDKRPGPVGKRPGQQGAEAEAKAADLPTVCFAKASRCDMVVDGRKIVGSAQVRRNGVILQHGSVPMTIDLAAHAAVMPGVAGKPEALDAAACGVSDSIGREVSFEELAEAIVEGFREALGVELSEGGLTDGERSAVEARCRDKYGSDEGNLRRPSGAG